MLTLAVNQRDAKESLETLRKNGQVPAVFYGPKEEATPIAIDERVFDKIWREAGETTIVNLTGIGDAKQTLIHDVQLHPVTDKPLHADFYVIEKGKKVTINVPLEFEGLAPAEKAGHIVVKALHEVEIEVAPAELPHHLIVDLSTLADVGDHITASQIKLPPSAELKTGSDEIIVSITAFVEEKPLETEVKLAEVGEEKKEGEAGAEGAPAAEAETKKEG
ncbi:50S ribosomal protein L25 [Candidatus Kaiserbacteria bacterium]|nr:50S ribosomal protein L25 [Candidatus Kaiserbacteria bacterium]